MTRFIVVRQLWGVRGNVISNVAHLYKDCHTLRRAKRIVSIGDCAFTEELIADCHYCLKRFLKEEEHATHISRS